MNSASHNAADDRPLSLAGAFIRRTDLSFANLERANLTRADMTRARARGANFRDAILDGAILHGADLTSARNLTLHQLAGAAIDDATILPDYIDRAALSALIDGRKDP